MNLRNLYLINMVVAFVFGLALLLGASTVLAFYGMKTGPSEELEAQLFGSALLIPALLSWFAKDFADAQARRGTVISFFVSAAVGFIVSLLGTLSGAMKSAGWSAVIIFLFFALGYGYFLFFRQNEM